MKGTIIIAIVLGLVCGTVCGLTSRITIKETLSAYAADQKRGVSPEQFLVFCMDKKIERKDCKVPN